MDIQIDGEFIQLGQFLKLTNHISSGGEAKIFLQDAAVYVNGERESRRGRKLYSGDTVRVASQTYTVIQK